MILGLLSLTPLIGLPFLHDGFSLPKTAYIVLLSVLMLLSLLYRREELKFPLVVPLSFYLGAIMLSGFSATNLHAFFSQLSLDIAGVIIFFWIVNSVYREGVPITTLLASAGLVVGSFIPYGGPIRGPVVIKLQALALSSVLPLLFILVKKYPHTALGLAFVAIYFIAYAASRAVLVGLLVLLPVGILMVWRAKFKRWVAFVFLPAILIAVLFVAVMLVRTEDRSRLRVWRTSAQVYQDHWATGIGRGNWFIEYGKRAPYDPNLVTLHAHGDLIELGSESGPLAAGGLIWFFGSIVLLKPKSLLGGALILAVITLFGFSFFWPMAYSGYFVYLFWTLCGLVWVENGESI